MSRTVISWSAYELLDFAPHRDKHFSTSAEIRTHLNINVLDEVELRVTRVWPGRFWF
jgi:hypothetical protein